MASLAAAVADDAAPAGRVVGEVGDVPRLVARLLQSVLHRPPDDVAFDVAVHEHDRVPADAAPDGGTVVHATAATINSTATNATGVDLVLTLFLPQ